MPAFDSSANRQTTRAVWGAVLSKPRSWIVFVVASVLFFVLNVSLKNYASLVSLAQTGGILSSLRFLIVLSGGFYYTVIPLSYFSLIVLSLFVGAVFMLLAFKLGVTSRSAGFSSGAGIFLGVFAPGCAACGVGLAALFGLTGATVAALPLKGLEISLIAMAFLGFALYRLTQSLRACKLCQIPFNPQTNERRITRNGNNH